MATATPTALLAVATTALVTTANVMNRVGGDLADDDTDVVAVSKLRRETRPRHFMQHALLPHGFLEVVLWHIPSRSPDLNPVERFWGWLKKTLHKMDLKDAMAKKAPLGKMAYRERVRAVCRSKKAQTVASSYAKSFRKVCAAVVKKKGAASGF